MNAFGRHLIAFFSAWLSQYEKLIQINNEILMLTSINDCLYSRDQILMTLIELSLRPTGRIFKTE